MKRAFLWMLPVLAAAGCRTEEPFARAFVIEHPYQAIGGPAALATPGDFLLENNRIRLAFPARGNSVGPGVFGGSLLDADRHRPDAAHRDGRGLDQFAELFPVVNLAVPAICLAGDPRKHPDFCKASPNAPEPSVRVLCAGGDAPCILDVTDPDNADYADPAEPSRPGPQAPSERAAIIRVTGPAGNYLEALSLVAVGGVKMRFVVRNDYILEPDADHVRIRTLVTESDLFGNPAYPAGGTRALPSFTGPTAVFGVLLGSALFPTELPDMQPGIAGGDFLFFGERLKIFAAGIGFDIYKHIRNTFALGKDPLNQPLAAPFLAGVGDGVSYAIASADPGGVYLLPLYSGAVTAGFSHGAHCHRGACNGTPAQCAHVVDCSGVRSFYFERLFAVGEGDVASAAAPIFRAWKTPLGRLRGHVLDGRSGQPVTRAEVYLFPVPATMEDCRPGGGATSWTGGPERFLSECLEKRFYMGAVSHLRTDRRATDLPEGGFSGELPAGRYYLMAKKQNWPASAVSEIEIVPDGELEVAIGLPPPARVRYQVLDEANRMLPVKITVGQCLPECAGSLGEACTDDAGCASGKCVPAGTGKRCLHDNCPAGEVCDLEAKLCQPQNPCASDGDCPAGRRCEQGACRCPESMAKSALGEPSYPPGLGRYLYAVDGAGTFEIEPGDYDVWFSRGLEYSLDRKRVSVASGMAASVAARLVRQVDTRGWISGDFHVHGQNSYDAVVKHRDRVMAFAGEGVEILSTSDHDFITDLSPYVKEMGLRNWLTTQVGLELTTVELGHFLAFPLAYREWQDGQPVPQNAAIDWTGKVPAELIKEMRALSLLDPAEAVIVVAHPRDSFFGYFEQYGLDPYDPNKVLGSMFEWMPGLVENPLAAPEHFSGGFDALELFNSKRFELIRTPSVREIRDYNLRRAQIQRKADTGSSPEDIERELMEADRGFIKAILERTPAEQQALWNADGSTGCETADYCTSDTDCDTSDGFACRTDISACMKRCTRDTDCAGTPCLDGFCSFSDGDLPCTKHVGEIDEWFRLLDYGVVRTGMGNSDTHQLFTQTEAGCSRNWVRLGNDDPLAAHPRAVARAIKEGKVVASYGPFIELWVDDSAIGETLQVPAGTDRLRLRVRVQSPDWFDIDRVEIYRSGELIHVFTAAGDGLDPASGVDVSGLAVPNPRVINLDAYLDEPVPARDAWYVAVAMGLSGRDLSPVFSEHPYLKLEVGDILSRSFSSIPVPFDLSGALIPRVFRVLPYGVTNPVFVDVDGGGYQAPHPAPAWATDAARAFVRYPSPLAQGASQGDAIRALRHFLTLFERARAR